ncbi:hypothetical protein SAMN05444274_106141 [Mariniphaga anaerophila]|uniref:Uncharacterized protein n=1 Tax=Mariniphaga anaerophila TaxID=1484053 RepID=A0A1M5CII2_9BACT|nr:hypothetical protein [Mariniphaga anaerophila]SHF54553.1 hypothetical protein SAMN05444274_106141 [Mariniphaga anaerophila]
MKFKLKISKKRLLQFLLFIALTGVAFIFDKYFEEHPDALKELKSENESKTTDHGTICLFSQSVNLNAKSPVQKINERKIYEQHHNKFLQKCHQLRDCQILKSEPDALKKPLFLSYHHLIFRHYYFSHPDEVPAIS